MDSLKEMFRKYPIRFTFRIFVTTLILIFSLFFLIYPGLVSLQVAVDPSFRKPGLSSYTLNEFTRVSSKYEKWSNYYLNTNYGSKASLDSVSETEWPIFGSVFYLLITEEIKKELIKNNPEKWAKIQPLVERNIQSAIKIITDPGTGTWVKVFWGDNYLNEENIFYRMLLIMGITSFENLTGDSTHREFLSHQVNGLSSELMNAPYPLLDDYPGECWPNDVLWAVAAIRRADVILGTDHKQLSDKLMNHLNTEGNSEIGLPSFMANSKTGKARGFPRGSGNSGILIFAPFLNRDIAKQWYQQHEKYFWQENWMAGGFRENRKNEPDIFEDADSGPVVSGFGSVATVIGIGGARSNGRLDHSVPMTMEIIPIAWPTPFGLLIPDLMGRLMVDSSCLGEIAFLFSLTRPVPNSDVIYYKGFAPMIVWVTILFYLLSGTGLIYMEYSSWRKWLKKKSELKI